MQIYTVTENFEDADREAWRTWLSSNIVAYYSSEESAQKRIKELLDEQIKEYREKLITCEEYDRDDYLICIDRATNNSITLINGGEYPRYKVDTIKVLD